MNTIIVRYAEIGLKGKNRKDFELRLVNNIERSLKGIAYTIEHPRGRIFINTDSKCDLRHIFGISSYSHAIRSDPDMDSIKKSVKTFLKSFNRKQKFRVSAQRSDKTGKHDSAGIEREIGQFICDETGAKVSLKKFDVEFGVEIVDGKAYVFDNRTQGPGGLPVGTARNVFVPYESENSLAAAWFLMKRGCEIITDDDRMKALDKFGPVKIDKHTSFAIGSDQTLETLKNVESDKLILRPLAGLDQPEINKIIKRVKEK